MENFSVFYIFHSSFVVESKNNIIVFDFYRFPNNNLNNREFYEKFIKRDDKQVFVFSSHSHADHFNEEILNWVEMNENIIYIFSDDIKKYKRDNVFYVKEDDKIKIKNLKISVYGSTDLGVLFYVEIDGKNIFHSGDLHLWHWEDDTPIEEKEMRERYLSILNKIKIDNKKNINLAFVPVDPRLGVNTLEGVKLFNELLKPEYIVPMHFGEDYSAMKEFLELESVGDRAVKINKTMTRIF